ncbi:MAG: hypothetical protein C4558_02455 [Dehalococcoidia bacterium]|nr:MAG: hypothetical protein C4558_02455 [Dehalococcoidia bacterium]
MTKAQARKAVKKHLRQEANDGWITDRYYVISCNKRKRDFFTCRAYSELYVEITDVEGNPSEATLAGVDTWRVKKRRGNAVVSP